MKSEQVIRTELENERDLLESHSFGDDVEKMTRERIDTLEWVLEGDD